MPAHGTFNRPVIALNPASQYGYNVRTAAGAPAAGTDVIVNVAAGVTLSGSVVTGSPWNADCTITFIVDGTIGGPGGDGGRGGNNGGGNGNAGTAGGHGVIVQANVKTYFRFRGTGMAAGGGGGGAGGAGMAGHLGFNAPGAGGGGGQGFPGGAGGAGGTGSPDGDPGDAGSETAPGAGGSKTSSGGFGGGGGGLAGEGSLGESIPPWTGGNYSAAGCAIYSVGFTAPVVLEGNDAAHVKGQIKTT